MHNHIVVNHTEWSIIDRKLGFDLLNPKPQTQPASPRTKLKDLYTKLMAMQKLVAAELKLACSEHYIGSIKVELVKIIATV